MFIICYPGLTFSSNSISKLFNDIGLNAKARLAYTQSKLQDIVNKYPLIYIDGTNKKLNRPSNALSKRPYKEKYNGYDVINVITAY